MPEPELPSSPPPPTWIKGEEISSRGQDLLGLRFPVQEIGANLLDGITTISPRVRYISHRTWLAWRYAMLDGERPSFRAFSRPAEAAFVFGTLLVDPTVQDLIGPRKARILMDEAGAGDLPLDQELIKTPAVSIYTGPSEDLGLTFSAAGDIPGVTRERGVPLATAADNAFGATELGSALANNAAPETVSQSALAEYGKAFSVGVPEDEKEALLAAIFPQDPDTEELRRMATYAALLLDADGREVPTPEEKLFARARRYSEESPGEIRSILDGWLKYHVRDCLCVAHERALGALFNQMDSMAPRESQLRSERVIRTLLSHVEEFSQALMDLDLLASGEDPLTLRFSRLCERVADNTSGNLRTERGLRRWDGGLTEWALITSALESQLAAVVLAPVSWIMAERRAGVGLAQGESGFEVLDFGRHERLGLKSVIIPLMTRLQAEDSTLAQVLTETVHLVADHHIRIAMARFAQDPTKDVAVLVREGDRWSLPSERQYQGGRPESRIREAIGWLEQLDLIHGGGLTDRGRSQLEDLLGVLREAALT